MSVAGGFTDVHDINDFLGHFGFIGHPVSIGQLFLDQVNREQELVFQEQFIVSGLMAAFTDDILCLEEIAALMQDLSFSSFLVFFFSAWSDWKSGCNGSS